MFKSLVSNLDMTPSPHPQRPVLSLKRLCLTSAMTFPTAGKAMQHLVATGVARELTGQRRNRVFVYDAYLAILNEGGEPL